MKLLKKNATLKIALQQIQVVLLDPKHRIKAETTRKAILTEDEERQNKAFAKIAKELEEKEVDNES